MLALPKSGYFSRLRCYLAAMYPVPRHILFSSLLYIGLAALIRRASGVSSPILSPYASIGIFGVFAAMLLIRLMDEIKDREVDEKYFPSRPLPSGKIFESDIKFSIALISVLYLAANLRAGPALWMAAFVIGYALLMYKHFFIPHILRESLLLTLLTHNPMIAVVLFYLFSLFSVESGVPLRDLNWPAALLLIAMYWSMFFAWEIARKIRSEEEENGYVTYSQIFGGKGAVLIAWGAQSLAVLLGCYFYFTFSLSLVFAALLATGYAVVICGYSRFLLNPTPTNSKLGPFAQAFIFAALTGLAIDGLLFGMKSDLWSMLAM